MNVSDSDHITEQSDIADQAGTTTAVKARRFSPLLFIAGVLCLAIAGSVIVGADPFDWATALPLGWIAIIGAIAVGAAMVIAPARRK